MVTKAESSESYRGPPSVVTRRVSSVLLIILLYTAASPFSPLSWLMQIDGSFLFDRLFAGIILLSACYFQWAIASLTASVVVSLPSVGSTTTIRNGRVEQGPSSVSLFLWRTSNYWPCAACEALLLIIAEWGPSELLRRSIVGGVVAGLWVLGFSATPQAYKRWAWEHIKTYLFVLLLDEIRNTGRFAGAGGRRGRGRW
ncbi:hypothetical protein BX600DRAFT_477454 [Xylariales sp. PMI_506]|nr:hypothetical protein BX600DRAFT_477454 [Xylariales sp. PMI_506]